MSDNKKNPPDDVSEEAPQRASQDWDEVKGVEFTPEDAEGEDVPFDRSGQVRTDEHYAEGQDNPYLESDDALPDEEEEEVFRRNNSREGGRFDEV